MAQRLPRVRRAPGYRAVAQFREFRSLALSDDELHDMAQARAGITTDEDLPEYPPGLRFTIREQSFEDFGIDGARPGATVEFAAFARVSSVSLRTDGCRVELELMMVSLDDGEFVELPDQDRPTICLDENDHERLDLEEGSAERGHILHLMGAAEVVSVDDTSYGGKSLVLQITDGMVVEDEDEEAHDQSSQ